MLFNSWQFALFLPIVFTIYWLIPHKCRKILILLASYFFYMCWNPKYIFLILLVTLISYVTGLYISKRESVSISKIAVIVNSVICCGLLFVFKYMEFALGNIFQILKFFGFQGEYTVLNMVLPVGISFYTFQALSYVFDVYRGECTVERNIFTYAEYIAFFPQLVAGPIERTKNLLPQIIKKKEFDYGSTSYGLKKIAWGFYKKLAIADVVGIYVDNVYSSNIQDLIGFDYFIAIFFFTIQIYCDFSGYSDIAIGTAKLLGINLSNNFRSPYFSKSLKEFWERWHMTLSTWFKDYLYIPLGGSNCNKMRRDFNLLVTFIISGLWHGANWTYVVWGGCHGLAQIIEKHIHMPIKENVVIKLAKMAACFTFCSLTWVLFRAESISYAFGVIKGALLSILNPSDWLHNTVGLSVINLAKIMISIFILVVYDIFAIRADVLAWVSERPIFVRWLLYVVLVWMILIQMPNSGQREFVYFQF